MSRFDADAYAATLEPPTLVVGGRVWRGRHLSAAQWTRAMVALDVAQTKGSLTAWAAVARLVFGWMFDPPWWMLWRRRPSRALLALPPAVWQQGLLTFFASPPMMASPAAVTTDGATDGATGSADGWPSSSPPTAGAPTPGSAVGGPPGTA